MSKRRKLTRNQRILIATLIVAVTAGVVVPFILHYLPKNGEDTTGLADKIIEKYHKVTRDLVYVEGEIERLKRALNDALRRVVEAERQGDKSDAARIIEELHKDSDTTRLLEFLINDRNRHRDDLIERNREIVAVAYLRGDIDVAMAAIDEILQFLPDDMSALNRKGHVLKLRGKLSEAEKAYRRVLELGRETNDEVAQAAALGNLGLIYQTRGELDKAEEMFEKILEIHKQLGSKEGMAKDYGNLGWVYIERGDIEKAREYWEKSLGLYKRIGMPHMVEKVQRLLGGLSKD